jgi:DNA-binding beta-propeller fold protein YncE
LSEVSYLYRLSTFTGTAPVGAWPKLRMDRTNNEIYVLTDEDIRVFNQNGMEIYQISSILDERAGEQTIDVAVKEDGTIIFLTSIYQKGKLVNELVLGNYRGEPLSRFSLKNLPPELGNFQPDRILYQGGILYLANLSKMQIITVDQEGSFQRYYDIMSLVRQVKDEDRGRFKRRSQTEDVDWDMGDFAVDREGNILFTVPVAGNAFKLTPDLQLVRISRRGGGPDKFGIPAAIIADDEGNCLVSDVLQSVVKVFDKDLNFVGSFGGRHNGQDALFSPRGLAVDAKNRLYVSQTERAGVSVFQLNE